MLIPSSLQSTSWACPLFISSYKHWTSFLHYMSSHCSIIWMIWIASASWNRSSDWNDSDGVRCAKETLPVTNVIKPLNVGTDHRLFRMVANVTESMKVPVFFLDITTLSEYRKDAHTSVYTTRQGKLMTPEQQADPATYADCIHWCLPGLPDTWNELLFTHIILHSWPHIISLLFFLWNIDQRLQIGIESEWLLFLN